MAFTQDYLLRQILMLAAAIRRALEARGEQEDAKVLEETAAALGIASAMDPETLLRMDPASLVTMLELSAIDDSAAEWVAAALEIQGEQHVRSGNEKLAELRAAQAAEVRRAFGADKSLEELLETVPEETGAP